jgi:hypothetical protein
MIQNILEWFFDGKGQVILGMVIMGISMLLLICGALLTLRGIGFFNAP